MIKNKYKELYYIALWFLVTGGHFALLYFYFKVQLLEAIVDSVVFNFIFSIIGLSIKYPIQFGSFEKSKPWQLTTNHIAAASILVGIWFSISYFILESIFSTNPVYLGFLSRSIPARIATGVVLYSIYTLVYYLLVYYQNLQNRIISEANLKALLKETELKALKSQINPHFLFNSLNSISSLTISSPTKAQEMIIKLSDFLRYSLKQEENKQTPLKEEIENSRIYLEIEEIRFGEKLHFKFIIPDECYTLPLPNMILQPLYENAIKYGVYESIEPVCIKTEAKLAGDYMEIKITNDFDPEAFPQKGEGIGLKNIRKRLELVYKREGLLRINKQNRQFEASLYIPHNENNNN